MFVVEGDLFHVGGFEPSKASMFSVEGDICHKRLVPCNQVERSSNVILFWEWDVVYVFILFWVKSALLVYTHEDLE